MYSDHDTPECRGVSEAYGRYCGRCYERLMLWRVMSKVDAYRAFLKRVEGVIRGRAA